jgi:hypothetical protein
LARSSFGHNVTFFVYIFIHFFCSSKRTEQKKDSIYITTLAPASSPQANEPKKKRPEMKNFVHPYARYTCLIGATVWPKFRTISGLPWRHFV